ncbi:iron ABC transporter ATP-binding protein [Klebsiella pneumoniae]|nr:ABC transporter ATP-binding protein [Klebsiella pneumoniae]STW57477.1 iron ABC transporter ATP-binding protein [Klebsiella pneumoniae]
MSICAENITWKAGKKVIVNNVSLRVPRGETVGLLGPNGCGKSSLLRVLAGLRRPDAGRVTLDGQDIARALAQSPSEILLDEPTNHLDIHHQMQLMQLISELPVTSIVAIHDLNHAAMFCDSLIVMQQGQILASGTPEEILSEALLWDVFRVKTKIEISPYHGKKHIHFIV